MSYIINTNNKSIWMPACLYKNRHEHKHPQATIQRQFTNNDKR